MTVDVLLYTFQCISRQNIARRECDCMTVCAFMSLRVLLQRPRRVFTLIPYSASAAGRFQPYTPALVNIVTVKGVVPAVKIDGRFGQVPVTSAVFCITWVLVVCLTICTFSIEPNIGSVKSSPITICVHKMRVIFTQG